MLSMYHVQSIKYNDFVEVRNNMKQEKCNIKQGKSDIKQEKSNLKQGKSDIKQGKSNINQGKSDIKPKLPKDYTK